MQNTITQLTEKAAIILDASQENDETISTVFMADCSISLLTKIIMEWYYEKQYMSQVNSNYTQFAQITSTVSPKGMINISKVDWKSLRLLNLNNNFISNRECKYISKARFAAIQHLSLWNNQIESEGVFHLSKSQLKRLEHLGLMINKISLNAVKCINQSRFPSRSSVNLIDNKLTTEQMLLFLLSNRSLEKIWFGKNLIGQRNKNKLRISFSAKGIFYD